MGGIMSSDSFMHSSPDYTQYFSAPECWPAESTRPPLKVCASRLPEYRLSFKTEGGENLSRDPASGPQHEHLALGRFRST